MNLRILFIDLGLTRPLRKVRVALRAWCPIAISQTLLVAILLSCSGVTNPDLPSGAKLMVPPRPYALWWTLTEQCSGLMGNFSDVTWYGLPDATQFEIGGKTYQAYWSSRDNSVVVALASRLNGRLIRHEMLHALSGPLHSKEYFIEKCGGVVVCNADCLAEAGDFSPPPSDAPLVSATTLETEVNADPVWPSFAEDSGWVAVTVSVTNLQNYPVWATLSPVSPGANSAATFGYDIKCVTSCEEFGEVSEYAYSVGDRIGFGPRQTRRLVFDRQLKSGTFALLGFFNVDSTVVQTMTVHP